MPDIAANSSTTSVITVGGSLSDSLEINGDHDWIRVDLVAGQKVTITLNGITLDDPYLRLLDAAGTLLAENDDISQGSNRNSKIVFTAPTTGSYYLDVAAYVSSTGATSAGTYQLNVVNWTPPPVASYATIADQLVNGYWGGDKHHFAVTQGGSLSVNLTGLTAPGQNLAREALSLWGDVIGITFNEVATGGQITFDDNQAGASSDSIWSGGITSSANVNVSTEWLTRYGTSLNSYSFQTYIHEIGHALGLGHAGNYNSTADYAVDAEFANDAWTSSIMSYFDQTENTYYAGLGYSRLYATTPMVADIRAIQTLYGLSTTTRIGDTTYGFGNTSARSEFNAADGVTPAAYTIFDSGGIDTLDYSGYANSQRINLTSEVFSSVGGGVGNVAIAVGTVIENAYGGSGDDVIVGNLANNILGGGGGIDLINGAGGNDTLIGGGGNDTLDGDGGSDTVSYASAFAAVAVNLANGTGGSVGNLDAAGVGSDTLIEIENVLGSGFADILIGDSFANQLTGGLGVDTLTGGAGADTFLDSVSGLSGDTITDFTSADKIVFSDAILAGFTFSLSGSTLTYTGGSLTLTGGVVGTLVASAAAGGGVELGFQATPMMSRDVRNADGSHTYISVDSAGTQSWTEQRFNYDVQGRLVSEDVINDDGTRTFISIDATNVQPWSQDWFSYDAQGRLTSEDVIYDNGTHTFIRVDADGSKSWSQDWFVYDAQGRLDSEDVRYDNGTHTFINLDQANTQSWSQDWFTYDAQGRLTSEDVRYDNGTHTFIRVDADGSQPWSQDWFTYDAAGRLTSEDVRYDNGSHTFITLDATNAQIWSQQWFNYDTLGKLISTSTVWDDGHVSYALI